jgi:hypothetical protein
MANSTTHLNQLISSQAQKEVTINELFDAMSPAALYGRNALTTGGLIWGYYGGTFKTLTIANGTVTLTASTTNYVEADYATGVVTVNTTGFTGNYVKKPLYSIITNTTAPTSFIDFREPEMPIATTSVFGGVKLGSSMVVDGITGAIDMRIATTSVFGAVKIGTSMTVDGSGAINIGTATSSVLGAIKVGSTLAISAGVLDVGVASSGTVGGIKVGSSLSISAGVLDYTLPTATSSVLGGIKIGSTLSIASGVLDYNLPTATSSVLGGIKLGTSLSITSGVVDIVLPTATGSVLGVIKIGSGLSMSTGIASVSIGTSNILELSQNNGTTTGLIYGYNSGTLRVDNIILSIAAGTITLPTSSTSYVELSSAGVVSSNTSSFTADHLPMAIVVTDISSITSVTDKRSIHTLTPAGGYSLPTATPSVLGGVKIGTGLQISSGVLSVGANIAITYGGYSGSSITIDASIADIFEITLTNPTTNINITNGVAGSYIIIKIKQDATGGRALTFTSGILRFGTDLTSITLSSVGNLTDYLGLRYNSATNTFDVVALIKGF